MSSCERACRPPRPGPAPPIEPRDGDTRPEINSSGLQIKSLVTDMDNLEVSLAPSGATNTRKERRESLRGNFDPWSGGTFDHSGAQCEDDARKSGTKEGAPEERCENCLASSFGKSDRVQPSWTASRLLAKTAIFAATPVCNLVILSYGYAHGLLQLSGKERLLGSGSCKDRVSTSLSQRPQAARTNPSQANLTSQISWLDCPDPLLLLAASMAGGSLMLSYHQLNVADEFQTRVLIVSVCVGMVFGLCSGRTLLATALSILPWAIYAGLGFSDLLHMGRKRRMVRRVDKDGNGWADGVCEKV